MLRFSCFVGGIASTLLLIPSTLYAQPQGRLFVGTDTGVFSHVKRFDFPGLGESASFFAYGPSFTGGVRVAAGDVNNDGVADIITGAGPGANGHVKAFSGTSNAELRSFFAYGPSFTGGVYVAAGDINNDNFSEIITGTGADAPPQVKAFNGTDNSEIRSFFAYTPSFTGGVRVAAGDVNNDGVADIITGPGSGIAPNVKAFNGVNGAELRSFNAYNPSFTGGIFVASGDVNNDGFDDIITGADAGAPAQVNIFSGSDLSSLGSFLPYGSFSGGIRVAVGDVTGDGLADIITGTGPGAADLRVFRGGDLQQISALFPYGGAYNGGIFVAAVPEPSAIFAPFGAVAVGFRRSTFHRRRG